MWCVPEIDQQFVERMEDVLSVYARPHNKTEPVVCLDERPVQLLDPARAGLPIEPGKPRQMYGRRIRAEVHRQGLEGPLHPLGVPSLF
jgi:hypothetical protein